MAIPRFDEDLAIISKLGDNPGSDNNLTTDAFRAKFDEGPLKIQNYLNNVLIPAADQSSSPQEGLSMQGGINMNGNKLTGISKPEAFDDAVNLDYVRQNLTIRTANIQLSASGWEEQNEYFIQTVVADDVLYQSLVFVEPIPSSRKTYQEVSAFCSGQGNRTLTFECDVKPEVDLFVNLIIFGGYVVLEPEIPILKLIDDESGYEMQVQVGDETYGVKNATVNQGAVSGGYDFTVL